MNTLTDEDLQRLQEYLLDNLEGSRCMPLDVAHGFITAVVSGPKTFTPADWMPPVLGQPEELDDETAGWLTDTLMALNNNIIDELGEGKYGPMIINKPMDDAEPLPLPYGWCEGYLYGLGLHGEDVAEQLARHESTSPHLAPILAFMMYEESQLLDPPDIDTHRELASELAGSAIQLYRWWQAPKDAPLQ